MNYSRLLIVASVAFGLVLAAAFRTGAIHASTSRAGTAGSLTPASPMLDPRSGHTATLLPDGKVLIAGGMRRNQDFYKSAELFDPATGKFQPSGRDEHRASRASGGSAVDREGADWRRMGGHGRHGFRGVV